MESFEISWTIVEVIIDAFNEAGLVFRRDYNKKLKVQYMTF